MLIAIALPKTDTKFNCLVVKEEKAPVPKEDKNVNIDKHQQEKQVRLPKLIDGEKRELEPGNSAYATFYVLNLSMYLHFLYKHL